METQKAVKMMLRDADLSMRDLYIAFGTDRRGASVKVSRGVIKIKDLLTIAQACGARVDITLASGAVLPLTLEQAAEDKPGTSTAED